MDLHRAALPSSAQSPPHPPNPSCGSCCPYLPPQAFTDTADSYLAPFLPRYRTAVHPLDIRCCIYKATRVFLFFSCACFPATDINFKRIPFVPQRTPSRTGGNARRGRGGCSSPICGLTSTPAPRPRRLVPLCVCVSIRVSVCIHIWICTEPTAAWQPAAGLAQRPASRGLDPQPISGTRSDRLVAGAQTVTPCWVLARLQYCS